MNLVLIESPWRGRTEEECKRNQHYLHQAMLDCLRRGEAPFASHALYTQCLDDNIAEERKLGMEAGWEWLRVVDRVVAYCDYGISEGMEFGLSLAAEQDKTIEFRRLHAAEGW